jgi:hypothetical protein
MRKAICVIENDAVRMYAVWSNRENSYRYVYVHTLSF